MTEDNSHTAAESTTRVSMDAVIPTGDKSNARDRSQRRADRVAFHKRTRDDRRRERRPGGPAYNPAKQDWSMETLTPAETDAFIAKHRRAQ